MVVSSNGIVQEYWEPLSQHGDHYNASLLSKVRQQIHENGIVRPKGYTVSWHSNPEIEKHHFGHAHPMKPWRLTLAKSLIMSYGMHAGMDTYVSRPASRAEMEDFHSEEYLDYLKTAKVVLPDDDTPKDFNLGGSDCPIFEGLFNYCSMYSGASIDAARKLCNNESQIAINWSGGLHHAKKAEASGFCYVNDITLAILQLLRTYQRVLYIDIDVHHGDGVEEAFWSTDRVMTLSIHKYDGMNFFPGTGDLDRTGPADEGNPGAHHAINVPLLDGIDDHQYIYLFKTIVSMCKDHFRPEAIVLQCGADSLAGDRLGRFNVQVQGHGACIAYCKSLDIPLLLVGGGGYTPRNVARAWAHETSIAIGCDKTLSPIIPQHTPYRSHFRYETIFPTLSEILGDPRPNKNTKKKITEIIESVTEQLRLVNRAPSVQIKAIPPDLMGVKDEYDALIRREQEDLDEDLRRDREEGLGVPMEH
ncbi:probable histone deacetylase HosA [Rhynchosporium agropyri]|uniref:Histone deacetylase n=3 Tax=Rhynchosporium TaxID=38037 RepID=A0A1E1MFA7_RHYSE|nr:probable histone deacetylase HosA [Rhynchosporium agropyri]CZT03375.1 probable histone deacetylase HosA [Rhynchosporium commune]CZT47425.1 probable histone deacetylase HosA [Rhynchosporium secalis]